MRGHSPVSRARGSSRSANGFPSAVSRSCRRTPGDSGLSAESSNRAASAPSRPPSRNVGMPSSARRLWCPSRSAIRTAIGSNSTRRDRNAIDIRGISIEPLRVFDDDQERRFRGGIGEEVESRQRDQEEVWRRVPSPCPNAESRAARWGAGRSAPCPDTARRSRSRPANAIRSSEPVSAPDLENSASASPAGARQQAPPRCSRWRRVDGREFNLATEQRSSDPASRTDVAPSTTLPSFTSRSPERVRLSPASLVP